MFSPPSAWLDLCGFNEVHEALEGLRVVGCLGGWVELGRVGQWFMPTAEGRTPSCAQRTANKVKVISQKRVALFVSQLFRDSDMAFALPRWETGNSHLTTI